MATSKTWPGGSTSSAPTAYSIPEAGELNWAALRDFLIALADSAQSTTFQKFATRQATTSPVTVSANDCLVTIKLGSPGAVTVNLPAGANKQMFYLYDETGDAATNTVTINRAGSDTIEGATSTTLTVDNESVMLVFDSSATDWKIVQRAGGSGNVQASGNLTDNAIVRGHGGAKVTQTSAVIIDDSNNVSGVAKFVTSGTVGLGIASGASQALKILSTGATHNIVTHYSATNGNAIFNVTEDASGNADLQVRKADGAVGTLITGDGGIAVTTATDTTSGASGSIRTAGGIGAVKDIHSNAKITGATLTDDSFSVTSGAITGVTTMVMSGDLTMSTNSFIVDVSENRIAIGGALGNGITQSSYLNDAGDYWFAGYAGNGSDRSVEFYEDNGAAHFRLKNSSAANTFDLDIDNGTMTLGTGLRIVSNDTTDSTSGITGSIQTDGGIGAQLDIITETGLGVGRSPQSGSTLHIDMNSSLNQTVIFDNTGSGRQDVFFKSINSISSIGTALALYISTEGEILIYDP